MSMIIFMSMIRLMPMISGIYIPVWFAYKLEKCGRLLWSQVRYSGTLKTQQTCPFLRGGAVSEIFLCYKSVFKGTVNVILSDPSFIESGMPDSLRYPIAIYRINIE